MSIPLSQPDPTHPASQSETPSNAAGIEDEEDDDLDEEEEEEDEEEEVPEPPPRRPRAPDSAARLEKLKMETLIRRMKNGPVSLRVHDVIVRGNTKTKDHIIEAETAPLKSARTIQEVLKASSEVNLRLQSLDCFDTVRITLDAGPPEFPGTANVIIDLLETANPISGQIGAYTQKEARSPTVEGSLKYKNFFGYGDIWDSSLAYSCDHSTELSAGVHMPRFKSLVTPVSARVYLLSQDWLNFSSYQEKSLGLSLGLFSSKHHDLAYGLAWRTLMDPSQMSSRAIRRQLGQSLISSLKYTFSVDKRNSVLRPTQGYSFVSSSQVGGLVPDGRALRFLRQELDLKYAIPLGFYRAALNVGICAGLVIPWGNGYLNKPSPIPERFFLGGNVSPVCAVGGPTSVWGFKTRGLGPVEPRRQQNDESADHQGMDFTGGDLAAAAFADLSFDLSFRWLREKGIHFHAFASAGNSAKLTENEYKNFSAQKFLQSFRSSVGVGLVVPTSLFRMEVNYCYVMKKLEYDRAKSGYWVTFSASR